MIWHCGRPSTSRALHSIQLQCEPNITFYHPEPGGLQLCLWVNSQVNSFRRSLQVQSFSCKAEALHISRHFVSLCRWYEAVGRWGWCRGRGGPGIVSLARNAVGSHFQEHADSLNLSPRHRSHSKANKETNEGRHRRISGNCSTVLEAV